MYLNRLTETLAMGLAPQQGATGTSTQSPLMSFVPMVLIVVVFYFLLIRPQQKRAKQLAELVKALKANDRVATSSGIIGTVISVKDNTVMLRSADSKLEITKASVTEILNSDTSSAS